MSLLDLLLNYFSLVIVQKLHDYLFHEVVPIQIGWILLQLNLEILLDVHLMNYHPHLDARIRGERVVVTSRANQLNGPLIYLNHDVMQVRYPDGAVLVAELSVRLLGEVS